MRLLLLWCAAVWQPSSAFTFLRNSQPKSFSSLGLSMSSTTTSNTSTTQNSSRMDTSRSYTDDELRNALDSLLDTDVPEDGNHLYQSEELSMLQRITATVILDYQNYHQPKPPPIQKKDRMVRNLEQTIRNRHPVMALAAEFKRASPSKGQIVAETVAADSIGVSYAEAGADIISVLTESRWFQGSLDDLAAIRSVVPDDVVLLRKDFVSNTYMIDEAKAAGADTVLLIVAVLPKTLLRNLIDYCRQLHMEPLVEIHNMELELPVALEAGAKVIGVNNRNLHTFQMDMSTTERVGNAIQGKDDIVLCALSGMSTAKDVHRYRQANCRMVLIGESLMRSADPKMAIRNLHLDPQSYKEASQSMVGGGAYTAGTQLIKVCGLTSADDALVACRAGANLLGVIFVPASPRCVATPEIARNIVDTVRAFGERKERLELKNADLVETVRKRPAVVGVFQNQDDAYIRQMVQDCGLDMVQLHGNEGMKAANIDNYGVPVIRVVDIHVDRNDQSAAQKILDQITPDPALILLDTAVKGAAGGGTGIAFNWSIAEELQNAGLPVIVAGGLNPDSVVDCIQQTRPFGVDVSSGVEASKGVKDHDKVRAFVTNAKRAALEASKGF